MMLLDPPIVFKLYPGCRLWLRTTGAQSAPILYYRVPDAWIELQTNWIALEGDWAILMPTTLPHLPGMHLMKVTAQGLEDQYFYAEVFDYDPTTLGQLLFGAGAKLWEYQLMDCITGNPVPGVLCWVTSDRAGKIIIGPPRYTNDQGRVWWRLAPGTVYVWRQVDGYVARDPDEEVVT